MIVTFPTHAEMVAGAADGDATGRTIRGTAVPWNQVGTVADGTRVRFLPGSLDVDARPIVTIGHDGQAIGRTAENTADAAGMSTAVRVSRVAAGDDALTLAADGVLGMFSVGVNPTDWYTDDDDVMCVKSADWHHTALLPFGAFADAVVTDVAASQPPGGTMTLVDTPTVETDAPAAELVAAAPTPPPQQPAVIPVAAARPAAPPLTLQRVAALVASANRGEIDTAAVKATIQAALANITTTNIGSVVPAYRGEITGLIDHGTPLINALGSSTLPASGMSIEYPQWVTLPTTGIQAVEKTQIVSTPVSMTMKSAPVITIAGGNDISLQAVERSSPSFLEAYLRAASADWARKASAYVIDKLDDAAVVATPGTAFLENVQKLLAALDPALTPAGPLFVAMSYDVAMPMIGVQQPDGPAFWDGHINFGGMTPTLSNNGGLDLIVDTSLPAGTMIGGSKNAATVYKSAGAPADIRVVDVSLLGLDVGVYGYLAVTVEYPKAIATMTGITPP